MPGKVQYCQADFEAAVDYVTLRNPWVRTRTEARDSLLAIIRQGEEDDRISSMASRGFLVMFNREYDTWIDATIYVSPRFTASSEIPGDPARRTAWDHLSREP